MSSAPLSPAARFEVTAENQLQRDLGVLGLNPMARTRLGLKLARARAFDLARQWAEDGGDQRTPTAAARRL